MNHARNEKLAEHLLNVDAALLSQAYDIDDGQKLRAYINAKKAEKRKALYRAPVFRIGIAAAACAALLVGLLLFAPKESTPSVSAPHHNGEPAGKPSVKPEEDLLPWQQTEKEPVTIKSLDMLNYYTAMKALAGSKNTASYRTDGEILALSAAVPSKKYYYQLDPSETFSVTNVVFFRIEIKNADGFLASKVGTGIVDVVITENSLEPMITFKNGERYYSCCQNAGNRKGKTYSSHKYIEGLNIVKNLEQENYSFTVIYDNFNQNYEGVTAMGLTCASSSINGGDAADGELPIVSKTYVSNQNIELTIGELEAYFNADEESKKRSVSQ